MLLNILQATSVPLLDRIWRDPLSFGVLITIAVVQLGFAVYAYFQNLKPLRTRVRELGLATISIRKGVPLAVPETWPKEVSEAWNRVAKATDSGWRAVTGADPESVFRTDRFLPGVFNSRLDAAAPGMFTAMGIIGTFAGLIIGFLRVDPSKASESVTPLIAAMSVAFVNSLLGVSLSLGWSWLSRVQRHDLSLAVSALRAAVSEKLQIRNVPPIYTMLEERLTRLGDTVGTAVSTHMEAIVRSPFERLTAAVDQFTELLQRSEAQHEKSVESMQAGTQALIGTQAALQASLGQAKAIVELFSNAATSLEGQTGQMRNLLNELRTAGEALTSTLSELKGSAQHLGKVTASLSSAQEGIGSAADALQRATADFGTATERLDETVRSLKEMATDSIADSVTSIQSELTVAVNSMVAGLREVGDRTVESYSSASDKVLEAVDARMTDLTDRLSAELSTLGARLPSLVEDINRAAKEIRSQVSEASRQLSASLKELATESEAVTGKRLNQFDEGLAKAVDHFSGTLDGWSGKVGELTAAIQKLSDGQNGKGAAK